MGGKSEVVYPSQETDLCHLLMMLCYSELFFWGAPEWHFIWVEG